MALTGITTPVTLWNSSGNVATYSGTLDVTAGQLIQVHIWAWTGTGGQTPSTDWTVTLDGVAMTLQHSVFSTGVATAGAAYWIVAPTTKTGAVVELVMGGAGRGSIAHAWQIDGFDTTTPIAGHSGNSVFGADVTTLDMPNGFTPSQAGNGVCTSIVIKRGGEAASVTNTNSDGFVAVQTGATTTSDITSGRNWHDNPPLSPIDSTWTWTNAARTAAIRVEVNVAAGGGGVTGTLAATEAGADTFTGSGSVEVSGTLAALETDADTLAASGAVSVSGALAVTETGSDTFAATGTVTAAGLTGSMAAVETGADTIAATGAVAVSGSMSATETGADAFAATGSVSASGIAGAMAAVEAGADTLAGAGSVAVSGTLSATEAGADAFAATGSVVITLTMAVTETGTDGASFTGLVAVLGSLAAFETGADTFLGASDASSRRHATIAEAANGGTFPRPNGGSIIRG